MIKYEDEVLRNFKKGKISKDVFQLFNDAFIALEITGNMNLFDVKRLRSNQNRIYYRLRKK